MTAISPSGAAITVVPANKASWADLQDVFGTRGDPSRCQCQYFKTTPAQWRALRVDERAERLREQTGCGHPGARTTSGLLAYLDRKRAGWCAVEPRPVYVHLLRPRARCRRDRGLSDDHPRGTGDRLGELYTGSRSMFADAGFTEVSRPTRRRLVMRIDF